jgi:hypothetical protein
MPKNRQRFWLGTWLCVGMFVSTAHAEEKVSPEARAYFKNGVELLQTDPPNYQDAYYQFKLAYEKSHSWKVLGNFGLCAVKLERDGEAIAFYDEYLKRGGKQIKNDERSGIERDLLLIKGNGATLELSSATAELSLSDARSGSTVPPQAYALSEGKKTLIVRAGSHEITARAADGRSLTWNVNLEPGSTVNHDFDFDAPVVAPKAPPPSAPFSPEPPPPESTRGTGLRTAGFITIGVGALALGGGLVTGLMAKNQEKKAKDGCDNLTHACFPSSEAHFDSASTFATATNVLLIGGGVLAGAGIGLVIFGSPSKPVEQTSHLQFVPLLSGNSGGLLATGRF